jgi:hypothetical protein
MKIQQFLEHHGIASNPFADEDAQTDLVFKTTCIRSIYHPSWDKIYGNPAEPATSVVFGEKGSGKTALRMQIVRHLTDYNADHPGHQALVVEYDDFNPFLDRFRERLFGRKRRASRVLGAWQLWDHMDAILSLAVTQVVDRVLEVRQARHPAARDEMPAVDKLNCSQRRDLLLLAVCYDQSTGENREDRWRQLRRRLQVRTWPAKWDLALGIAATVLVPVVVMAAGKWSWFGSLWPVVIMCILVAGGWAHWVWRWLKRFWQGWRIAGSTRSLNHSTRLLRRELMQFTGGQLIGQPMPALQRTEDRYALLDKLQSVLRGMDMQGILVLVDRVDEPYLVNGSTELMRALVWPLLDNKFLKHPGMGVKMLLPIELERLIDRQESQFHQRARLDKQNMIRSLAWTGQSLYDMANARILACAAEGASPSLAELFDGSIGRQRLVDAFEALRVPRNLFKFMYRLFTTHCNAHSDEQPVWQIDPGTFESVLALYRRDQEAFERGVGAG